MFSITHLSALSSLKSLEHLEITYRYTLAGPATIHGLNDGTFAQLIKNFPQLRTLVLNTNSPALGGSSVQVLSQTCPLLERCALIYPHDLCEWFPERGPHLSFPNLASLYIGKVAYSMPIGPLDWVSSLDILEGTTIERVVMGIRRATICAKMLLRSMPNIQSLGIETASRAGNELLNALNELRPCKPLGVGDVAEEPITTIVEQFSCLDFLDHSE